MHRALKVAEVLQLLCFHIYPHRGRKPSRKESRALARLARTCTTFSEPALDALWSFQNTIVHVINCMPAGIFKKDWSLRRPIHQSDWERPLRYMYRVRVLSWTDELFSPSLRAAYIPVIFETLRLCLPTPQLFPNLVILNWNSTMGSSLIPISLLLSQKIRSITLGTFRTISDLSILASIPLRCPLLRRVELIQAEIRQTDQSQTISAFVRELHCIRSLVLDHLDQTAFEHLARCSGLRILYVGSPQITSAFSMPARDKPAFAALTSLSLGSAPAQCVLACIRTLSRAPLASFEVTITPPPDTSSTQQIYVATKKHLPRSLTTIRITSIRIPAQQTFPIEPPAIKIEILRHLFHFENLASLELCPPTGIDVDDDAIRSMAKAWPRLEILSLTSRARAHPLRTTLRSLLSLAQHCPLLEHLEMGVNATDVPNIDFTSRRRVINYNLVEWDVGDSRLSSPLLVARFLSGLFPELKYISTEMQDKWVFDDGVADILRMLWREVEGALPICRDMRDEERYWMENACDCRYGEDDESDVEDPKSDGSVEV
ncbi:hypothetical protein MVEN_00624300 [Mycena venus]|uniref:F-box domain-containing protein n=1 Tax=Mycena venus TaxID=2733690 RepID=A0A8H6YK84_9AGAR|nr:hypothetical protein MVEN_00624300 [Mycena venus]